MARAPFAVRRDPGPISKVAGQEPWGTGGREPWPLRLRRGRLPAAASPPASREATWDTRFVHYLHDAPAERGVTWLRLTPDTLTATDLSYATTLS